MKCCLELKLQGIEEVTRKTWKVRSMLQVHHSSKIKTRLNKLTNQVERLEGQIMLKVFMTKKWLKVARMLLHHFYHLKINSLIRKCHLHKLQQVFLVILKLTIFRLQVAYLVIPKLKKVQLRQVYSVMPILTILKPQEPCSVILSRIIPNHLAASLVMQRLRINKIQEACLASPRRISHQPLEVSLQIRRATTKLPLVVSLVTFRKLIIVNLKNLLGMVPLRVSLAIRVRNKRLVAHHFFQTTIRQALAIHYLRALLKIHSLISRARVPCSTHNSSRLSFSLLVVYSLQRTTTLLVVSKT